MHIPLDKLPIDIQEEVIAYLKANDFIAAKHVRDLYELRVQNTKEIAEDNILKSQQNAPQKSHLTDID